jgi:TPR repeat protein
MTGMRLAILCLALCTAAADIAVAGGCRVALAPLLLQSAPDKAVLGRVRELCLAEADRGDPDSLYQVSLFHLGLLDWDVDTALPMIRSAADRGVAEAQYWLAWQYEEGPLLPNDAELALRWYHAAGDGEHRLALNRLAAAYQRGELGLASDARKAAEFRARAARCN